MKLGRTFIRRLSAAALALLLLLSSGQSAFAQYVCQLATAPTVINGTIEASDADQTGRINRNGIPSSCVGKTNSLFAATVLKADAHDFTNTTGLDACVTIDFDATGCGGNTTQAVAYSSYNPALPGDNVIGDFGFSTTGVATFSFPVAAGANFTVVVHEIAAGSGCPNYSFTVSFNTNCRQPGTDVTNDGLADLSVFRPGTTNWEILNSVGGQLSLQFGINSDTPVPGDYTGDGITDLGVARVEGGGLDWYYGNDLVSPSTNFTRIPWGVSTDVPVPGDYDGDGATDIAIYRPSEGTWYILRSSDLTLFAVRWGAANDIPVTADFDGDLKTDIVVVRPDQAGVSPNLQWFLLQSNFNYGFALTTAWGSAGDIPVPADYDGNGKADITIFRPSTGTWWSILSNAQNAIGPNTAGFQWGVNGDVPQPADYDGDGTIDRAVFRPSNGVWYVANSGDPGNPTIVQWGQNGDIPTTAAYPVSD
ncbi:MAG TPA: VCBS repeat-containing protein [Aridibacter sp.]|nr:VCBS repeat-containing protein [Aridibacter sp.]